MALRRQEAAHSFGHIGFIALLFVAAGTDFAQNFTFEVRHRHWHGGAPGTLRISSQWVTFQETGKNAKAHSRQWTYDQIQQLTLTSKEIHILTYGDSKRELGRDREYVLDHLPEQLASQVYPLFSRNLNQRFIAALPVPTRSLEWSTGAKLTQGVRGTLGTLVLAPDQVIFDAGKRDVSRTWPIADIENASSSGPFDLTLTTGEKSGFFRGSMRQFHFQLQIALPENRFNTLWRSINRSKGLRFLDPEPD